MSDIDKQYNLTKLSIFFWESVKTDKLRLIQRDNKLFDSSSWAIN